MRGRGRGTGDRGKDSIPTRLACLALLHCSIFHFLSGDQGQGESRGGWWGACVCGLGRGAIAASGQRRWVCTPTTVLYERSVKVGKRKSKKEGRRDGRWSVLALTSPSSPGNLKVWDLWDLRRLDQRSARGPR